MASRQKKSGAPAPAPDDAGAGRRILLIEDEPDVAEMLAEMLACEGHTAVPAADGEQGLARFRTQAFDAVVTDLAMPGMSGWDVAREIKKLDHDVPVIMLTGWDAEFGPAEIRTRGVDRYIKKPFTFEDIMGAIDDLCGPR